MSNLYTLFKSILPNTPLQIGTVTAVTSGGVYVDLPTGGKLLVRGVATVGNRVFVRDGVIEGIAPNLTVEVIDV